MKTWMWSLIGVMGLVACEGVDEPGDDTEEGEVITTVVLELVGSTDTITATWADPEDDGDPVIDDITLTAGETYAMSVSFLNELEDPAEDITEEIMDEDDEHQVFFTGTAVDGPAEDNAGAPTTHAYADTDANGLPVGLENDLTAEAAGNGMFTVTLRHLPPEDGVEVKVADMAETVATSGFGAIGGDNEHFRSNSR